jgi:hypothetical protein
MRDSGDRKKLRLSRRLHIPPSRRSGSTTPTGVAATSCSVPRHSASTSLSHAAPASVGGLGRPRNCGARGRGGHRRRAAGLRARLRPIRRRRTRADRGCCGPAPQDCRHVGQSIAQQRDKEPWARPAVCKMPRSALRGLTRQRWRIVISVRWWSRSARVACREFLEGTNFASKEKPNGNEEQDLHQLSDRGCHPT